MFEYILAALLTLPTSVHDSETDAERRERLHTIAEAINVAADGDLEVAAFLVMTGDGESKLARHIHEGNCKEDECDNGKAATLWQVWKLQTISAKQWRAMQGTDLEATTIAASYAARLYRMKKNVCGQSPIGGITAYATGKCYSKHYEKRAQKKLRELRKWQARLRS